MTDYQSYTMFQPHQQPQQQPQFRYVAAAPSMQTQQQQQQPNSARSVHATPMHSHSQAQAQAQQPQQQHQAPSQYIAATPFQRGINMQMAQPLYTTQQPANTAHSQLLYQYLLPLEVHAAGKDRCRASMIISVSSSITSSTGQTLRSIQLQCHQESDPYFLYFAHVTEQEYPRIKQAQNLNVDFTNLAAEIEGQISKVDGARKIGQQSTELVQAQQEVGSPSSQPHQQFDYSYHHSHHDAHNISTLSLATGSGSGSGSGASNDMMSAQFLMHSASVNGHDGTAEFKLIYRHNFRMMDILSLAFTRASEAQLKKFMVEGWGSEKTARMQAEAEIQKLRQSAHQLEGSLEEARNTIMSHSHSSDSQANSQRIAFEQEMMETRERHAAALAAMRATQESELSALSKEWESKHATVQNKFESLSADHQKNMVEKAALNTKLSTLTVEHEHAMHELAALRSERTSLRQSLQSSEAALGQSQSEVNKTSIRLAQLEAVVEEKSSVNSLLQSSAVSEQQKHSMLSEGLAQSKREVAHLTQKYSAVCQELQRGNEALGKLQAKLKASKDKSGKQKEVQAALEERLLAQESALKDATHKCASALQEKQFVESERDRVLSELKSAQSTIVAAQAETENQMNMVKYLSDQLNKAPSKLAFSSSLLLPGNPSGVGNGGLRALDAGLTRPSFNSALATPLPLADFSNNNNNHNSPSPGAAPLHDASHNNNKPALQQQPAHISSVTLSKATRALLANKENAYTSTTSSSSLFSPAQQGQQPPLQANPRMPLTASSRLTHNTSSYVPPAATGLHKPAYTQQHSQHDLSYYAPAALA